LRTPVGEFDDVAAPREYAQNLAAAHNAGIAVAWLVPEFVRSLRARTTWARSAAALLASTEQNHRVKQRGVALLRTADRQIADDRRGSGDVAAT
jgi:hypothetical protein